MRQRRKRHHRGGRGHHHGEQQAHQGLQPAQGQQPRQGQQPHQGQEPQQGQEASQGQQGQRSRRGRRSRRGKQGSQNQQARQGQQALQEQQPRQGQQLPQGQQSKGRQQSSGGRHHGRHGNDEWVEREGVIQHHGRFAFLLAEKEGEQDGFLRGRSLSLALDGDRVLARMRPEPNGRFVGDIVKVLKHARTTIVGILKEFPKGWALFPERETMPPALVTGFAHGISPKAGALAVLEVTTWPTATTGAAGKVIEIIGSPSNMHARITSLVRERELNVEFPKDVLAESEAFPQELGREDWKGREELFNLPVCTIDGIDAKDFDDAVSLEELPNGLVRLGVHIADVSHYVKPGTALDKEAYARATSVYLPDRVIPMLPQSLSNNLCSLVAHKDRLTVSVFMDIEPDGKVVRRRINNTVIRSCRRFTYEQVQTLLDGGKVEHVPQPMETAVLRMGELAQTLTQRRIARGSLDFDLPEYKIEVDEHGKPLQVIPRPRLASHRLVEEFMLLANEAVATELMAAKIPFLHRRHDEPSPDKLKNLAKQLGEMGYSAGHITHGNTHKALQEVLRQADGDPLEGLVNSLMVRSMKQAVYSPVSSGHFGIAAKAYAHFTSPIRRYPDLMVHRAVKALIAGEKENSGIGMVQRAVNALMGKRKVKEAPAKVSLTVAGEHCSERERAAAESEYKAIDILRAELMRERVGQVAEGMVTNVTEHGAYVLFADTGAEGMIRMAGLKPGTQVKVIIDAVDTVEGKIDLTLAEQPKMGKQAKHFHPAAGKKQEKGHGRGRSRKARSRRR